MLLRLCRPYQRLKPLFDTEDHGRAWRADAAKYGAEVRTKGGGESARVPGVIPHVGLNRKMFFVSTVNELLESDVTRTTGRKRPSLHVGLWSPRSHVHALVYLMWLQAEKRFCRFVPNGANQSPGAAHRPTQASRPAEEQWQPGPRLST